MIKILIDGEKGELHISDTELETLTDSECAQLRELTEKLKERINKQ